MFFSLSVMMSMLAAGAGSSSVYFEQSVVTSTDGVPNGNGVVSRVWYAGQRMRMEAGGVLNGPAFILRLDSGTAYRLDPQAKTATLVDLERLRAQSHMDLAMAADLMTGDAAEHVRTTPLKTMKTIAGHRCEGYRLSAGSTRLEVYLTRDLPLGIEAFADFLRWSGADQAMGPLLDALRELPGFPLETRSRVTVLGRVHETTSTVTTVRVEPIADALFEPPAGYRTITEAPAPEADPR
jgi:hypothetical protein